MHFRSIGKLSSISSESINSPINCADTILRINDQLNLLPVATTYFKVLPNRCLYFRNTCHLQSAISFLRCCWLRFSEYFTLTQCNRARSSQQSHLRLANLFLLHDCFREIFRLTHHRLLIDENLHMCALRKDYGIRLPSSTTHA